jgi:hypothetical protein
MMPKLLFYTILISGFSGSLYAQGEYDKCYFGTAGIDFTGGNPYVLTNSQMIGVESAASMCSQNGDLLFYSNGGDSPTVPASVGAVWNANHVIMENGILGSESGCISSFDGAVAFPKSPSNSNFDGSASPSNSTYYIFMRDCVESSVTTPSYNSGLTYCEIDMDANNGLGKVVNKGNQVVPFDPGFGLSTNHEPLAAISNANDDGWFVFSYTLDSLYSIEVDDNGIGNIKVHVEGAKRIVFSPSKEHVIVGGILYNYNNLLNELSVIRSFPESSFAFSPNGRFLYAIGSGNLNQYDLTATNIFGSKVTISSGVTASRLYLTPDARVYLFNVNGGSLPGVINCPNSLGTNCDFSMTSFNLGGKQAGHVFTNIPANYLFYNGADCNLSVNDYKAESIDFEVYPNPSNGNITISMDKFENPVPFNVVSLEGKVVFDGMVRSHEEIVDLSSVENGIYFLEVNGKKKRLVLR